MADLTTAERRALAEARYGPSLGAFFIRIRTRVDVVTRLKDKGFVSKRAGWLLTAKGEAVRAKLIGGHDGD